LPPAEGESQTNVDADPGPTIGGPRSDRDRRVVRDPIAIVIVDVIATMSRPRVRDQRASCSERRAARGT
jgi:hypothetical protein